MEFAGIIFPFRSFHCAIFWKRGEKGPGKWKIILRKGKAVVKRARVGYNQIKVCEWQTMRFM